MQKKISILGSTGSIGLTTLKILEKRKNILNLIYFPQIKTMLLFVNK